MPRRHQRYGRGRLRNVRGSCPTSVDPGMPEETRGTETSQYPEERKSTETPSVAASDRGPAPTRRAPAGGGGAGVVERISASRSPLENGTAAGDSPVGAAPVLLSGTQVGSGT